MQRGAGKPGEAVTTGPAVAAVCRRGSHGGRALEEPERKKEVGPGTEPCGPCDRNRPVPGRGSRGAAGTQALAAYSRPTSELSQSRTRGVMTVKAGTPMGSPGRKAPDARPHGGPSHEHRGTR